MSLSSSKSPYAGYGFPAEVISQAVWLYFRFPLSLRMVEEMLAAGGIVVSHETVRQWALESDWSPPSGQPLITALGEAGAEVQLDVGCVAAHSTFERGGTGNSMHSKPAAIRPRRSS